MRQKVSVADLGVDFILLNTRASHTMYSASAPDASASLAVSPSKTPGQTTIEPLSCSISRRRRAPVRGLQDDIEPGVSLYSNNNLLMQLRVQCLISVAYCPLRENLAIDL